MKHVLTTKVETTREVEVVTPSYRKSSNDYPTYFRLTEEGGELCVTRVTNYDNYFSIVYTKTVTSDCLDGLESTPEEFNEALTKLLQRL